MSVMKPLWRVAAVCSLALGLTGCPGPHIMSVIGNPERSDEIIEKEFGGYDKWQQKFTWDELMNDGYITCAFIHNGGHYSLAEKCLNDQLARLETPRAKTGLKRQDFAIRLSGTHTILALIAFETGSPLKGREHVDKALRAKREFGYRGIINLHFQDTSQEGRAISLAGEHALSTGEVSRAQEYAAACKDHETTLPLLRRARNGVCARLEIALGNYAEADRLLQESVASGGAIATRLFFAVATLGISEADGASHFTDPTDVDVIYAKGLLCEKTQDFGCAKRAYDLLRKQDWSKNSQTRMLTSRRPDLGYDLPLRRGNLALADKDFRLAEGLYWKAIEYVEGLRASVRGEGGRINFSGSKDAAYRALLSLMAEQGRDQEAFALVERGKARALVDMLASKKSFGAGARAEASTVILASVKADAGIGSGSGQRAVDRGLKSLAQQKQVEYPEIATLTTASPARISEIQARLEPDETLLEYFGEGDTLYAFLLTPREPVKAYRLSAVGLSGSVQKFRSDLGKYATEDYLPHAQALYRQLIAPLTRAIRTTKLTIVPHGQLHYVPFAALHDGAKFLVRRYALRLLPSANVLPYLEKGRTRAERPLLVLGNPERNDMDSLPAAEEEAVAIARANAGQLALRGAATETLIKTRGGAFRRLHIASHGTFDPERPLSSALMLSADQENDGILSVSELYNLELNADLVTLSACETALGNIGGGDDVVGFTRGLLFAGAKSIVSSLWKVDDAATSALMQAFYRNLDRQNVDAALQAAQIDTLASHPHPYYWAAFQLTGAR